jgi:hypothetical protein
VCKNKAAISLCKDRKEGQRVKHIDVIRHFARDHVRSVELSFVNCKPETTVSGCLTKASWRGHCLRRGWQGWGCSEYVVFVVPGLFVCLGGVCVGSRV